MLVLNVCAVPDGLKIRSEHSAYRECVCVYVCVFVCMCVYMYIHTQIQTVCVYITRGAYGGLFLSLPLLTLDNSIDAVRGTEVVSCDLSKKSRQLSFPTLE